MKTLWKTIGPNFESHGHKWKIGKWYHVDGEIKLCENGFHASPTIFDAMGFVTPGWVCQVKAKGQSATDNEKSAWSNMMIVSRCKWTKKMSAELAIYAAELVLPIFEKEYPDDKRPRNAIEAARAYLKKPSSVTMAAARAARATWDAWDAAGDAAGAAARATARTAWDAWAAAGDAAWNAVMAAGDAAWNAVMAAAWDTAWAAARAAGNAAKDARAATKTKIEKKIRELIAV